AADGGDGDLDAGGEGAFERAGGFIGAGGVEGDGDDADVFGGGRRVKLGDEERDLFEEFIGRGDDDGVDGGLRRDDDGVNTRGAAGGELLAERAGDLVRVGVLEREDLARAALGLFGHVHLGDELADLLHLIRRGGDDEDAAVGGTDEG